MNSLTRFWHETAARLRKPFRHDSRPATTADPERDNTVVQLEQVRDKLAAAGKAETARLASLERRLADLETEHAVTSRQLQVVEQELTVTRTDLETTTDQVTTLAQQVEEGQQLYLQTVQETQLQLRKQEMRLNWLALVAAFALLLAAIACVIFIWDVQKNARLLAGMSADIKALMLTVERQDSRSPPTGGEKPAVGTDPQRMQPPSGKDQPEISSSTLPLPESGGRVAAEAGRNDVAPGAVDTAPVDDVRQFFARNATMPGIISLPGGVQYRVVREGDGRSPGINDWVVVDYLGMTPDGRIFDNTYDSGQRAIFGMDGLLPGWREPLMRMQEGSEFEIYVPPDIANIGGITSPEKNPGEPGIYLIELIQVVGVAEDD